MRFILSIACSAAALTTIAPVAANASAVLKFVGSNICSDNQEGTGNALNCVDGGYIHQSYGDSIGVDVQYRDLTFPWERTLSWWGSGYAGADAVLWGGQSDADSHASITLKALSGYSISLESLGLSSYAGDLGSQLLVRELGGNVDLVNQAITIDGSTGTRLDYSTASSSKGWVIAWQNSAWSAGLSQLTFSVNGAPPSQVPEPTSLSLVALALAVAGARHKRRSK